MRKLSLWLYDATTNNVTHRTYWPSLPPIRAANIVQMRLLFCSGPFRLLIVYFKPYLTLYTFRAVVLVHTGLCPTTAQCLVSTLVHVLVTHCGHLQGAIVLHKHQQHIT